MEDYQHNQDGDGCGWLVPALLVLFVQCQAYEKYCTRQGGGLVQSQGCDIKGEGFGNCIKKFEPCSHAVRNFYKFILPLV